MTDSRRHCAILFRKLQGVVSDDTDAVRRLPKRLTDVKGGFVFFGHGEDTGQAAACMQLHT